MIKERIPDFLIIGAQKSATTALKYYLDQHPDIAMPFDELHYFDQRKKKGLTWYLRQFGKLDANCVGEKTPGYIVFPEIIPEIYELFPACKIIVCLRNPIDRAYSEYMMLRLNGTIYKSFEDYMFPNGKVNESCIAVRRGKYGEQLIRVYTVFPKNQILILFVHKIKAQREVEVKKVFTFLGVDNTFIPEDMTERHIGGYPKNKILNYITSCFSFVRHNNEKKYDFIHTASVYCVRAMKKLNKRKGYPPMKKSTRRKLEQYFIPEKHAVEAITGEDLSEAWWP